jgi:cobalt-zinc-cadmium efflux system protein
MSHNHSHNHHSEGNISVAFYLNAVFVVIELVGGLLTNSIAILSDALHDFGDCLSLAVAWALQRKSRQGRDAHYSYGSKRFSLLGSIFLSGILFVSSLYVIYHSVGRILSPQEVSAQGMLWLAIVGIVVNGSAALRVSRGHSLNERSVYLHIMEDVLGWAAVLVVSVVMLFVECPVLDPLLSVAISLWVLTNVYRNLRSVFAVLLQAVPDGVTLDDLRSQLEALPEVTTIHDLHVWSMDGETHVASVHVVLNPAATPHDAKLAIRQACQANQIAHVTIETECADEPCDASCD